MSRLPPFTYDLKPMSIFPFTSSCFLYTENMFIKPLVSKETAREAFLEKRGFFRKPVLERVELVYLPYYVFTVEVSLPENREVHLGLDGIEGVFSFFNPKVELAEESPGEAFDFILPPGEAEKKALEEYRWMVIREGIRKKSPPEVKEVRERKQVKYPYWVGYYRRGARYDFKMIDAVSGGFAGIKMRRVLLKAFEGKR